MGALHSRHLSSETAASQQILSSSRIVPHPGPLLTRVLSKPLMDADNLALAQAAISVILLVAVALRPFVPRRPRWCRPFAREQDDYAVSRKTLWTRWTLYLATMAVAGLASSVASVILGRHSLPRILELAPWMAAGLITAWRRPVKTPTTLLALYLSSSWPYFVNFAISLASIFGILAMPMRDPSLLTDGIGHMDPTYTLRSPEDNLTLWTFMTVSWMAPLISRGKQRKLNDEDIWQLPFDFQHDKLHTLFRDLQGSIVRRLLQANGLDLLIISVLAILESAANLSMPLLLKKLLESMELGDKRRTTPIMFAAAILCVRLVACQSSVFSLWFSRRCYERSRGEMITTIYAKTLTRKSVGQGLPEKDVDELDESDVVDTEACQDDDAHGEEQHAKRKSRWTGLLSFLRLRRGKPGYQKIVAEPEKTKQPATTGKILNLMKSDVYEVAQRFWDFPQLIVKPLQFIVSLVLVWQLVGWPCLVGIACILVAQVLNAFFIRKVFQNERVRRVAVDERLQATSQFVEGIRHLRWYDWQSKWVDRIMDTRQRELARMVTTRLWVIGISTLNIASGALFPVATFFAYTVLAKKPLTVGIAFPALQLFTMLQSNFRDIPGLIQVLLNASIAVGRIEQFMEEPDKDEGSCDDKTNQIDFKGASFAWPGTDTPVLRDLNFDLPQGLTVVFGKVGSGKTALLQAILGELDWVSGDFVIPNDMIGYCAQLPWLQHMNIRENILFSAHYDAARYRQVLDACELLPDLREFKDGDLSDMGENGIGLSDGGIMGPLQLTAWFAISWISSMGVIASLTPLFLAFSLGVSAWFVYIFLCFLPTSQSLRRLEMVSLSPLMSNFGILLDGLGTIRAFNAQPHFQHKNIVVVDAFQKMDHFYWSLQSWLMYRFDALSAVSTFALTIVALQKGFSPSLTAFVLTTASQFVEATHNLCRQYGTLQMDFVSVERVIELLSIPSEPCGTTTPPAVWPAAEDAITFNNVTLKYAPHLDPSLVDASFTIPGGSTCAVLGRTGSGKSTLALALLATMHPTEGTIMIGDYKLSDLDVHAWRQRISFVAQDPVLFPGTLRDNLDPLRQFSDGDCASVLARVLGGDWTIKSRVEGGGKNLSQGQRQLVGIGRAVLRRSPLVVLDEATASIDRETAAQVQKVLKGELEGSTVVTIAHRLEAVEGADWFIRLDAGKVIESGPARGRI
ncbi:hypothetical protein BN1723_007025 [Verticillium longisporum]|uniref:ABC transporter domain-containing protein n=1 Tax=Verticillium longisporum TaxID=100787 RepID=A0A0G4NJ18_VERLO|nr:hypothetical protein BN1723_007025 [Verticillium longisporum]